jgi:hypothetical protein
MAEIQINAVSAGFQGTNAGDDFKATVGNLRDITVEGLAGDDVIAFGSAASQPAADGGVGLGFSIGSSTIKMSDGDDSVIFSGQGGSGFSQFRGMTTNLGEGDDFAFVNGLASASGSVLRGNTGNDQISFLTVSAGAATAHDIAIAGGAGADALTVGLTGSEASDIEVRGGAGTDTISATFGTVSASVVSGGVNGALIKGNKNDDLIVADLVGTSDSVVLRGNSGADTFGISVSADATNLLVAGGKQNDSVSANFATGISSIATTLRGDLGDDTIVLSLSSGGFAQTTNVLGGSGNDVLTITHNGGSAGLAGEGERTAGFLFGDNNTFDGGTGADTINVSFGADINTQGTAGFVVNLGAAGTVSGGTAGLGGALNLNISATQSGGGVRFIGTDAGDDFNITQNTGIGLNSGGALNGAIFSAESGADSITFSVATGGSYSAINIDGGAGADVITAEINGQTLFNAATGGQISVQGGAGNDTVVVNIGAGSAGGALTAAFFAGNDGDDVLTVNLAGLNTAGDGAQLGNTNSGTQFFAGSGADTIGLSLGSGASAAADIQAGSGNDLITATVVGTGGTLQATTALAGDGDDTIAITFALSETAGGIVQSGGEGAVFNGGSGADSITLLGTLDSAGEFDLGEAQGGEGVDTITLGSTMATTGLTVIRGAFNGGLGGDSLIFSGNNFLSGGASTFVGNGVNGSGGFVYGSGESLILGFDTVSVANEAVTGGQVQQAGTFGSAGITFANMTGGSVGDFNMSIATAGSSIVAISAGQSIFNTFADSAGGQVTQVVGISTGGVVAATEQISAGEQGYGAFLASGGSTTAEIFSAVEGLLNGRGQSIAFNIQNGSAGSVDGFVYVDGGVLTDEVIKFAGNGLGLLPNAANSAGLYFIGGGGVSAGFTQAGQGGLTRATNAESGGQLFFGANVGVG